MFDHEHRLGHQPQLLQNLCGNVQQFQCSSIVGARFPSRVQSVIIHDLIDLLGLTISEEGGFEDVDEFLVAAASLASVSANLHWVAASSVSTSANCCSSALTRASSSRDRGHSVVLDGASMTPPTYRAATKSTKISFLPVNGCCSRLSVASEVMPSRPETQARPQEVLGLRVFKEWLLPVAEMSLATVSARRRRSDRFPGPNRLS